MEGPSFLKTGEASLPPAPSRGEETITDDPVRGATQMCMSDNRADFDIDPSRFSTFSRLFQVTGWIKRFAKNCRRLRESRQLDNTPSSTEVREAETFWVKQAQSEAFPKAEREECLLRLSPKPDNEGVLRIDGRLRHAGEPSYDTRLPILLPKNHVVSQHVVMVEQNIVLMGMCTKHPEIGLILLYDMPRLSIIVLK